MIANANKTAATGAPTPTAIPAIAAALNPFEEDVFAGTGTAAAGFDGAAGAASGTQFPSGSLCATNGALTVLLPTASTSATTTIVMLLALPTAVSQRKLCPVRLAKYWAYVIWPVSVPATTDSE